LPSKQSDKLMFAQSKVLGLFTVSMAIYNRRNHEKFSFNIGLSRLASCSTIKHAVGGALGGGLTAAFIPEPAAVAAGAAGGVMVTELILPSASPAAIAGQVLAQGQCKVVQPLLYMRQVV
jgi:uncharacterized protein (DUF2062 family)